MLVGTVMVAPGQLRSVGSDWESGFVRVEECNRPRKTRLTTVFFFLGSP